ncbi:MAG: hypothetical protein KGH81_07425, partial [Thaumarchaeota archaeon]|nr:hypothetical protein [Nitrososphaerota archaeon]
VTQGTVNVSTAMVPVVEAATVPDAAALLGLSAAMTPVTDAASINAGVAELGLAVILADMAALVAATSTTLPGSYAYIAGYYSAGDGGAGLFRYVASDTTSADNSGTIVVDASGRRWYRVWDGRSTSIREWGAKVDGSTDDSTSIQAAINFLQSGSENMGGAGGVVIFPTGTVLINAGITVSTGGITLQGAGWEEYLGYQGQYTPGEPGTHGTTVLTTSTSASPITLASDAANNAAVRDMMFRQTQPADASGWTPTTYPPTINVTGSSSQPGGGKLLENLFCWNCYEFIRIGSVGNPASRVDMRRIWGMPLQYGINGIFSSDIDRFNDIHFWQFDQNVPNIISWIQLNGVAMQATRLDGFMLHQFFAYGYAVGLALTSSTDGASQNFAISDFGADSCWWGILVNGTSGLNSGRITNAYHQSATGSTNPGGGGGYINSGTGPSNLDFANAYTNLALTSGVDVGTSDWSFANLRVTNYNQKSGGTYKGVNADTGGSVTLSGRVDITGGGSGPPTGGTGTVINWSGTATTNATASRALNSTYTNSTGKAMTVSVTFVAGASGVGNLIGLVAGNGVAITSVANNTYGNVTFVVPDGDTYEVTFSGTGTLNTWQETH